MGSFTSNLAKPAKPLDLQPLNSVIYPTESLENLDKIFMDGNFVKPLPYKEILSVKRDNFLFWCMKRGVYQYPTIELLEWLKNYLKLPNPKVLEIGAGNGAFSRYLGTKASDSKVQETPEIKLLYSLQRIGTTNPPDDVEKLDAVEAIRKYQPEIVFGTYITNKWKEGDKDGFDRGVDHEKFWKFDHVKKYIMIGNSRVHAGHTFLKIRHNEFYEPWLISRSEQTLNRIFVWEK